MTLLADLFSAGEHRSLVRHAYPYHPCPQCGEPVPECKDSCQSLLPPPADPVAPLDRADSLVARHVSFPEPARGDPEGLPVPTLFYRLGVLREQSWSVTRLMSSVFVSIAGFVWQERKTTLWWAGLCVVSLLNVNLWLLAARVDLPMTEYRVRQLLLSSLYVAVCAFRSAFPRVDLERVCLWDTPLSAIFAGRSVATLAEICFAVQCTIFLSQLSVMTHVSYLDALSLWIVPAIVIAQCCCWYAVITLNPLGHAIEELLWTVIVALLTVGLIGSWFHVHGALRIVISSGIVSCGGAVCVMSLIDVPMYIARWRQSRRGKYPYLSLMGGLTDTLTRRHATHSWIVWRHEVPWMTLYFSVAVWLSIGMTLLEYWHQR